MLTFKEFLKENSSNPYYGMTKTHMALKPNGERQYVHKNPITKTHVTGTRSGKEIMYHPSSIAALRHLHGLGYTNQITSNREKDYYYVEPPKPPKYRYNK